MAAAIPKFTAQIFDTPLALQQFVTDTSSVVASIVAITTDNAGKWVLFYIHT